ncbi:Glycosyltransferase involved in cell wall bisynthesis [Marinobacter segnicrescens]|uniref:Glycosyltransferase involved in cell wall bisynthesis n=1 Tax=Marinobacter segnicrescens TaxID=430453 RepID=A0A1I0HVR0_9GAMM|nr:Glycosyltransferase involved in cell wall bisynthesis [Marinobacter segnicrescens]
MYMPTPGGLTGAPRRMLTLARELKGQGVSVCVASDAGSEVLIAAREQGIDSIELDPVGGLKTRGADVFRRGGLFRVWLLVLLLLQNLRVFRVARKAGADVVWLRGSKGVLFAGAGCLLARKPVVWDVDYELPSVGLVRRLHRFGLWLASAVVFQYRQAPETIFGRDLASRYQRKFNSIIPGIELDRLPANTKVQSSGQSLPGKPAMILQVGTVCDRKNQCFTADVLAKVRELAPELDFEWHIAGGLGDEAYVKKARELVSAKGLTPVTRFLGWRDDVVALMSTADLLIMPSRDEGVPNTVQEAMCMGIPVLVSDAGGLAEVVDREVTGWVRPLDSPEDWAADVVSCFSEPARTERIRTSASRYALQNFGTEVWGKRYLSILRDVLPGSV